MSSGVASSAIVLPEVLDIFALPSVPSSSGIVSVHWPGWPARSCSSRPTSRLKVWSVPPSSTSLRTATESWPCRSG